MRVRCLAQKHNTMFPVRASSAVKHTNHEAIALPISDYSVGVFLHPSGWDASPLQSSSPPLALNVVVPICKCTWVERDTG